jgi:hypothetical protein
MIPFSDMIPIAERHTPERHHGNLEIVDHPQWIKSLALLIEPFVYVEYGIRYGRCVEQIVLFDRVGQVIADL